MMVEWKKVFEDKPVCGVDLLAKDEGGIVYAARYQELREDECYFLIRTGSDSFVGEWDANILGVIEYYAYLEEV